MSIKKVIERFSNLICSANYYRLLEDVEYQVSRLGYADLPLLFRFARLPKEFIEGVLEAEGYVETPVKGRYTKVDVKGGAE